MKFKLTILCAILLFSIQTITAQRVKGEGDIVKKEISLGEFHSIHLSFAGDIILSQGKQQVVIEAQENLIELLNKDVNNGVWKADFEKGIKSSKKVVLHITMPDLKSIYVSGSGSVKTEGKFSGLGDVNLKLSGSGDIAMEMEARDLELQISGSGDVSLSGSARETSVAISGSGDVNASNFKVEAARVKISGSGDVKVFAEESLDAKITGSGDVMYKGSPKVQASVSGSGEIKSQGI